MERATTFHIRGRVRGVKHTSPRQIFFKFNPLRPKLLHIGLRRGPSIPKPVESAPGVLGTRHTAFTPYPHLPTLRRHLPTPPAQGKRLNRRNKDSRWDQHQDGSAWQHSGSVRWSS